MDSCFTKTSNPPLAQSISDPATSAPQYKPISPQPTSSGHPPPTFAAIVAGGSAQHPLTASPDYIASVQQTYRSLDHRKLWTVDRLPRHPDADPAIASSRFTKSLRWAVEDILAQADLITGPRPPTRTRGWDSIMHKLVRRATTTANRLHDHSPSL